MTVEENDGDPTTETVMNSERESWGRQGGREKGVRRSRERVNTLTGERERQD